MLKLRRDEPWFRMASGFFLVVICVALVITLIPGMDGTSVDPTVGRVVAEVGSQEVTTIELQDGLATLTRSGRVPLEMAASYSAQVLDDIVLEKATLQEADRLGIHVSETQLQERLRLIPDIFPNGKFIGKQQYEDLVYQRIGQTTSEFERRVRNAIITEQLRKMVTDSVVVSPEEVQKALREENESFVLSYVYLNPENLKKEIATPDPLVQAYFDKNKNRYQVAEKRSGKLLVLDRAQAERAVTVADADLRKYYQDHAETYRVEERVLVSQIFIKIPSPDSAAVQKARSKAEDLSQQILRGANFEELARKNSEDASSAAKGGDMGFIVKGQTETGFEQMAFGLQPGHVSAPVQTEAGFHLIKVREHQQPHVRPFEEVRAEIETAVRAEKVQSELSAKAEAAAAEWRKAPGDADKLAAKYSATVTDIQGIERNDLIATVPGSGAVVQELFTLEKGWVGKPTTVNAGIALPMLTEVQGTRPGEFEEVKEKARADYLNEQARTLALIQAQSLAQAVEKQEKKDLAAAARAAKLAARTSPTLTRTSSIEEVGPASQLTASMRNLKEGDFAGPVQIGAGQMVYQIVSRSTPPDDILTLQRKPVEDRLRQQKQGLAFSAYQENLKKRLTDSGDLVIHENVLTEFGRTFGTVMP